MKLSLLTILVSLVAGCVTEAPTKQASNETRACVFFQTDDVLYTGGLGEAGVQGATKRIEAYLTRRLNERGIQTASSAAFTSSDAKLTVKLDAIETVTSTSPGLWMPKMTQRPRIKYFVTLLSHDGTLVLTFEDKQDDESVDNLTRKIGEKIADRVARYFR
jgi:hypothetical protein